MGRRVEIEPSYVHPQYSLAIGLHVALAIAGSLVALLSPAPGFALVLFAAFSLYLDQSTRYYLLRRLLFRRASQNIVSPGSDPDAPGAPRPQRPLRRGQGAASSSARSSVRLAHRLSERWPGAARADPPDLLGRRRPAAAGLGPADGGSRRHLALDRAAGADRHRPRDPGAADRHRPLRGRPRRLRQRLRGRRRPLGGRGSSTTNPPTTSTSG